ncbi:MAG: zf-HC2 domain-containing protein [Isosphaeraceae bacterium]
MNFAPRPGPEDARWTPPDPAPDRPDPALYGLGKLDDGTAEEVNRHLETCNACRQRVAGTSADSFLGRIRDARRRAGDSRTNSYISLDGKPIGNPPAAVDDAGLG